MHKDRKQALRPKPPVVTKQTAAPQQPHTSPEIGRSCIAHESKTGQRKHHIPEESLHMKRSAGDFKTPWRKCECQRYDCHQCQSHEDRNCASPHRHQRRRNRQQHRAPGNDTRQPVMVRTECLIRHFASHRDSAKQTHCALAYGAGDHIQDHRHVEARMLEHLFKLSAKLAPPWGRIHPQEQPNGGIPELHASRNLSNPAEAKRCMSFKSVANWRAPLRVNSYGRWRPGLALGTISFFSTKRVIAV